MKWIFIAEGSPVQQRSWIYTERKRHPLFARSSSSSCYNSIASVDAQYPTISINSTEIYGHDGPSG